MSHCHDPTLAWFLKASLSFPASPMPLPVCITFFLSFIYIILLCLHCPYTSITSTSLFYNSDLVPTWPLTPTFPCLWLLSLFTLLYKTRNIHVHFLGMIIVCPCLKLEKDSSLDFPWLSWTNNIPKALVFLFSAAFTLIILVLFFRVHLEAPASSYTLPGDPWPFLILSRILSKRESWQTEVLSE